MANTLPEGTDTIIDGAAAADLPDGAPGFGATGENDAAAPAQGSSDDDVDDEPEEADERKNAAPKAAAPKAGDARAAIGDAKAKLGEAAAGLKDQATDRAREYAVMGKDRATETLHNFSKMIEDAAATVDDKVGAQYGDYARQAAETVKGFAASLEGKDVDELFEQARDAVAKSPAIAVGAAAAIGFVLSRIAKSGFSPPAAGGPDVAVAPDPDLAKKG